MNIEKMLHIAKEDLQSTLNNEQAEFADRHMAMQTYLLAQICEKIEGKEQQPKVSTGKRRLIVTLTYICDEQQPKEPDEFFLARIKTFKRLLIEEFPSAFPNESTQVYPTYSSWTYWISDIDERYIAWVKAAAACGLIDAYIVDYDPDQEVSNVSSS